MIKDENYYVVQGWMRNRLHLKGNDLIVYALIYSFSQDGESEFKGSISYITDFTGAHKNTVIRTLDKLEADGLIEKIDRNTTLGLQNWYRAVPLNLLDLPEGGAHQNGTPPAPKKVSPLHQIGTPPAPNWDPINNGITNTDSYLDREGKKESRKVGRKKDTYKEIIESFGIEGEEEKAVGEFIRHCHLNGKRLTDEGLRRFIKTLHTYDGERERVAVIWKAIDEGKLAIQPKAEMHYDTWGVASHLSGKSYQEVMDCSIYKPSEQVKAKLWEFIRYYQANGRVMTNDRLSDLIRDLWAMAPRQSQQIELLDTAIKRGYFDIKQDEGWIAKAADHIKATGAPDPFGDDDGTGEEESA